MSLPIRSRRRISYNSDQAYSRSFSAEVRALCNLTHNHMSQVHTWKNTEAREVAAKFGIAPDATICRPYRDDVRRVTTIPTHSPRSEKINQK